MNKRKRWLSAKDSRSVSDFVTACTLTRLTFAARPQAVSQAIALPEAPAEDSDPMKPAPITPFLLFGETTQGFMTVEYREARVMQEPYTGISMTGMKLGTYL
jgi:hypothetical protein